MHMIPIPNQIPNPNRIPILFLRHLIRNRRDFPKFRVFEELSEGIVVTPPYLFLLSHKAPCFSSLSLSALSLFSLGPSRSDLEMSWRQIDLFIREEV